MAGGLEVGVAIVVHFGDIEPTLRVAKALTPSGWRVVVVANDGQARPVSAEAAWQWLVPPRNLGYAGAFNFAVASQPDAAAYALLNNDLLLAPDDLDACAAQFEIDSAVAVVGPALVRDDRSVQHGPGYFGDGAQAPYWTIAKGTSPIDCDWITGAVMVVRGAVAMEIPMAEEYFLGFEDVDYGRAVKAAGYICRYLPCVEVVHEGGVVIGPSWYYYATRNRIWFVRDQAGQVAAASVLLRQGLLLLRVFLADIVKRRTLMRSAAMTKGLRDSLVPKPRRGSGAWLHEPVLASRESAGFRVVAMPTRYFDPAYRAGGVVRSLARLVDSTPPQFRLMVVTTNADLGVPDRHTACGAIVTRSANVSIEYLDKGRTALGLAVVVRLRRSAPDIVYVNDLFDFHFGLLAILLTAIGALRPAHLLISPRGSLYPGALRKSARKKKLLFPILRWAVCRADATFHASTEQELETIGAIFPGRRVLTVPDETGLPATSRLPISGAAARAPFVFVSRIAEKKGLLQAIEAVCKVPAARLDIWGPIDDRAYWDRCLEAIEVGLGNERIIYRGSLRPEAVIDVFGASTAFIFPTAGENFGHVIAECLSASCPVITTRETPWTSIIDAGGGVVAETGDELVKAVRMYAGLSVTDELAVRRDVGEAYDRWRQANPDRNLFAEFGRALLS